MLLLRIALKKILEGLHKCYASHRIKKERKLDGIRVSLVYEMRCEVLIQKMYYMVKRIIYKKRKFNLISE